MKVIDERLLILCKTYPSPSRKYVETSCVAAMTEAGKLIRIFPVPFRLLDDKAHKFKKWQWIKAKIQKANDDQRPESYRIYVDTIELEGEPLDTKDYWKTRRFWLNKLPTFPDLDALEAERQKQGTSLGLLKPSKIEKLELKAAETPNWTEDELSKLMQAQNQGELFAEDRKNIKQLEKLGHHFYYHYACDKKHYRNKIVDWEAGELYRKVIKQNDWEQKFRTRYEDEFKEKDLMFLMGTIHRFPDKWLIISVIYPPKQPLELLAQGSLF
jgi:hypothetical protein